MKFTKKSLQVLGYTRQEQVDYFGKKRFQWEFSEKAINLIIEYKKKFPIIFQLLESKPNTNVYNINDLLEEFKNIQNKEKSVTVQQYDNNEELLEEIEDIQYKPEDIIGIIH